MEHELRLDHASDLISQIGRVIRQLRLEQGITPSEFAEDICRIPSFVRRLENGLVDDLDLITLEKCAKALHVDVDILLSSELHHETPGLHR
jgi:transcriptional regulator with XRE-family HTH domain